MAEPTERQNGEARKKEDERDLHGVTEAKPGIMVTVCVCEYQHLRISGITNDQAHTSVSFKTWVHGCKQSEPHALVFLEIPRGYSLSKSVNVDYTELLDCIIL